MLVDGRSIAKKILATVAIEIKEGNLTPKLVVITCAPNFETRKYLELKKMKADSLGVELTVVELPKDANTDFVIQTINTLAKVADGIIVQLPLPASIDTKLVLEAVPLSKDVDAFSYGGEAFAVLPPVVGAIAEIAKLYEIKWLDKKVVIFGEGRLVGKPAAVFARTLGASVAIITLDSIEEETAKVVAQADIIILGAGKPNLLKEEMVKDGVVVFDAGASEDGGLIVGDSHPKVAEKASVFTPVPGGIGPITVALLYRNLLELMNRQ
jgi:methylenetetrahydrofolate dehydrogenase (NADP+) / methenyltetrahydrofolate cyclohydrolase